MSVDHSELSGERSPNLFALVRELREEVQEAMAAVNELAIVVCRHTVNHAPVLIALWVPP